MARKEPIVRRRQFVSVSHYMPNQAESSGTSLCRHSFFVQVSDSVLSEPKFPQIYFQCERLHCLRDWTGATVSIFSCDDFAFHRLLIDSNITVLSPRRYSDTAKSCVCCLVASGFSSKSGTGD